MPCRGPSIEEVNRSNEQVKLYDLIIDLHGYMGDETVFTDSFIDQCTHHRVEAQKVYNTELFFHHCTAVLCDKIRKFTEIEKENEHEKLDRKRVKK